MTRPATPGAPLSQREVQILALVGEGLPDAEIGARLHLTPQTIKSHLVRLRTKLGARDRTQAVVRLLAPHGVGLERDGDSLLLVALPAPDATATARVVARSTSEAAPDRRPLTADEADLLGRIANGQRSHAIAAALYVSEGVIKQRLSRLYRALGAEDRAHAVALALAPHGVLVTTDGEAGSLRPAPAPDPTAELAQLIRDTAAVQA